MEISEIRIKLMGGGQERLLGFCSITFDRAFVIRDLKIIRGDKGAFVAMPSRKLTDRCPCCSYKNTLRSAYCSNCGKSLSNNRSVKLPDGRARLYADIAHPINCDCREMIQSGVLRAYEEELVLSKQANYVCRYEEFNEFDFDSFEGDAWDSQEMLTPTGVRVDTAASLQGPHEPRPLAEPIHTDSAISYQTGFGDGLFSDRI